MMRSLWSGVSGLKGHQTAMDVEGNNIANVNTTGFKYSRADFSTIFSQTVKIATSPTGTLGGQNAMQIGLGTTITSTTRIHSQGSIQTTDKNTDVALNGDGFFIVSDDGGVTDYLTRSGDFQLDAYGNFVNNSGYVVQGWNIDWNTQTIDTSRSATNIFIDPGLHISAVASTTVSVKANLNSGLSIGTASTSLYALDSVHGYNTRTATEANENDTGTTQFYTTSSNSMEVTEKGVDAAVLFNASGTGLNLRNGQGIWISYADATYSTHSTAGLTYFNSSAGVDQNDVIFWGDSTQNVTLDITINGVRIQNSTISSIEEAIAYINTYTSPTDTRDGTGVTAVINAAGTGIDFVNDNADGTTDNMKNINLTVNNGNTAGELWSITNYDAATGTYGNYNVGGAGAGVSSWIDAAVNNVEVITAHYYVYSSNSVTLDDMYNPDGGAGLNVADVGVLGTATNNYVEATVNGSLLTTAVRTFHTTEDLRELIQRDARYGVDYDGSGSFNTSDINENVTVIVNSDGYYAISVSEGDANVNIWDVNANVFNTTAVTAQDLTLSITEYSDQAGTISTNSAFTTMFQAWEGILTTGSQVRESEQFKLSAFSVGLEIYDSLGALHTIEVQWVKQATTTDGGNEWLMIISVEEPAVINTSGDGPSNVVVGTARFNNDGTMASYTPRTLNFSPNNGAASNQTIRLSFGTSGTNDGVVSSSSTSTLTSQSTDGYASGSILADQIRVDSDGNILAEFTNGLTFAVATIAVATVANNSGLEEIGGNLYKVTANSGSIVVGVAGTGGRGTMATSSLEMSNTDLSTALTNLIVVQRGYQANSKTITTSDEMLQTLLQLK
ncbi:flagellar hook protein FlgE [Campylobacter sp. LR196d]|uniref:flagellar hook protein FlgE n=1 Tax=Campylobacter sp. LR196d TaxID=2593543 RepID=UPI001239414E|nr:flagellar hook protein FlgE [Campylobacter sp. LR196d]KAA6225074.1 flagellar hook protein FlgE [Campylobacter sp. LR196d]